MSEFSSSTHTIILFIAALIICAGIYLLNKYCKLTKLTPIAHPKLLTINAPFPPTEIASEKIPLIIWSYWHESTIPDFVKKCSQNWERMAPEYEMRYLNRNTIFNWVRKENLPTHFENLPPFRQADWLRLELLKIYGGLWIDASIILTQTMEWLNKTFQKGNYEYIGFYIEKFTTQQTSPVIENWFMAATPNSSFIRDLAQEFNYAISLGEPAYLEELKSKNLFEIAVQSISPPKLHQYLIMHVAASVILNRNPNKYRLALLKAEDTAFAFHQLVNWSKKTLHAKLALTPCPKTLPVLIKFRGGERNKCDELLKKGLYIKGSLLQSFLHL
jgi:Capsular polysaccharide synthesis protein